MKAVEGIKVVDFTWSIAGPLATKFLADYGATVIHVESATHPDFLRSSGPFKDGIPGINRSGYSAFFAANKYGLALNLNHPQAPRVTRSLVEWADVIADNFTPGVMARYGLDYESVRRIKEDVITLSISQMGQSGPMSRVSGTGTNLVGMAGFTSLTGWPDREPVQPFGGYPDLISAVLSAGSLLAALLNRRQTGRGQMIDVSQLEASALFMASSVLDYVVNNEKGTRQGNRCHYAAPNGVYPCRGDDRWCAISVVTETDWNNFCRAVGNPPWTREAKFSSLTARKEHEDELDCLVGAWTAGFTAEEVMKTLQEQGVAAGVVNTPRDLVEEPQLIARNTLWEMPHAEMGSYLHLGELFRLWRTPAVAEKAAPCLGEDTEYVCCELLGIPSEEFVELLVAGVFE